MLLKMQFFGYIIRTSWLYSKNFGYNFYRNILRAASNGKEIKVVKDQYGTPTNTEKLGDFITKIIISLPKKGFIIALVKMLCHGTNLLIK